MSRRELSPRAGQPPRTGHALYLRQGEVASGPYPRGLLERYVELGRVRASDELSHDGVHWQPVARMLPDVAALESPPADSAAQWEAERRRARLRWIEERGGGDRRQRTADPVQTPPRSGKDRRTAASSAPSPRPLEQSGDQRHWRRWNSAFVVLGVVAGVVLMALLLSSLAPGFVIRIPPPAR